MAIAASHSHFRLQGSRKAVLIKQRFWSPTLQYAACRSIAIACF